MEIRTVQQTRMTPEEFAKVLKDAKPYLLVIEQRAKEVGYGSVEVKLEIRAGEVEKMMFFESKTWLKEKSPQ